MNDEESCCIEYEQAQGESNHCVLTGHRHTRSRDGEDRLLCRVVGKSPGGASN